VNFIYHIHVQDANTTALHSLPDGLVFKESTICDAGLGVFTAPDFTLRKDKVFGPYAGVIVRNPIVAHESGYCWQVAYNTFHNITDIKVGCRVQDF